MTDGDYYIVDEPLPDALNFEFLKQAGIQHLKALSGKMWTNYNESDPGITILDQLCYALTELGYCAQFPIADVLTQEDGNINFEGQFFAPQNILTSSPVTLDDYRKWVLDNVPQVRVIYIEPESVTVQEPGSSGDPSGSCIVQAAHRVLAQVEYTGRYKSYLSLKDDLGQTEVEQILNRVQVLLNQHRNLAELFLRPKTLAPVDIQLAGSVWLTQSSSAAKVEALITQALINYGAPLAVQSGYKELLAQGLELDQIFNGPKSRNGWIAGSGALKGQRLSVSLSELTSLIGGVDGVWYVQLLSFSNFPSTNVIDIKKTDIPRITLSDAFKLLRDGLVVKAQSTQSSKPYLAALGAKHQSASVAAKIDLFPGLPKGHYRNIEEYYSVQNTFPDIYGIGYNSLQSDASNYRVAQSRQLKGYLMAFDQLLANQFSQVAHIGDLFSFGPQNAKYQYSGWPDLNIPHKKFTTTYHCQPLYEIPQVKPLLRGHDAFHYQFDTSEPENKIENGAWKKYKQFQFNEYIYGLSQNMESELEATTRRDAMLSHLMARHGDDGSVYDDMIATCQWFGSELKTRIIVKTIWLQNYELLSYNRNRAFDINVLNRLPMPGDVAIVEAVNQRDAACSYFDAKTSGSLYKQEWWRRAGFPTIDGEVNQETVFSEAKLKSSEFERFSAFELKAGILLGLPARWRMLAGRLYALLDAPGFHRWLNTSDSAYHLPDSDISVVRLQGKEQLYEGDQCLMDIVSFSTPTAKVYQDQADQLLWLSTQRQGFLLIESMLLYSSPPPKISVPYFLSAYLVFPNYVTLVQQPKFQNFIDTLVNLHWPAHVEMRYLPKSFEEMKGIIESYVSWKNNRDTYNSILIALSQKKRDAPTVPATKKAAKVASDQLSASKRTLALQLGLPIGQGAL